MQKARERLGLMSAELGLGLEGAPLLWSMQEASRLWLRSIVRDWMAKTWQRAVSGMEVPGLQICVPCTCCAYRCSGTSLAGDGP
ncbi:hypothetical protein OBRU01_17754 [Operophtera brumata]|uniref:Uncharacterized protein n=1 Tax=Operophtera brumata TaxID=104452 RepID=A0A0L7KZC1_OPEBR|nr:hypothetical protein OBRU01_17754 [Operophtera brumata]